tara:strand:+ start:1804 stop:2223 length:420 start_codon:yes stop_codon:yes gene_type:complete
MAKFVLSDASIVINSVDLSDHCTSVTFNYEAEAQENTVMGDTTRANLGGLLNYSVDVEFAQDYATNEVDATLFSIVGTSVTVVIKPTSDAVSTSNPSYTGSMMLQSYQPVSGTVGDRAVTSVNFVPGDDGSTGITRATS